MSSRATRANEAGPVEGEVVIEDTEVVADEGEAVRAGAMRRAGEATSEEGTRVIVEAMHRLRTHRPPMPTLPLPVREDRHNPRWTRKHSRRPCRSCPLRRACNRWQPLPVTCLRQRTALSLLHQRKRKQHHATRPASKQDTSGNAPNTTPVRLRCRKRNHNQAPSQLERRQPRLRRYQASAFRYPHRHNTRRHRQRATGETRRSA